MRKLSTLSLLLVFTILFGAERASAQTVTLTLLSTKKNGVGQCYQPTSRATASTLQYAASACSNGKLMIVEKATGKQTFIQVSSQSLTTVTADAYTFSVGSRDGKVYVYSNTPPFSAKPNPLYFSQYGLNSFQADSGPRGSLIFAKGSTELAMNNDTVFVSMINSAEVALEIDKETKKTLITYGQVFDSTSTKAYDRSGQKIGSFVHITPITVGTPALYANETVVIETTQARGSKVGIFDANTFKLLYLLPEPYTNVVTVVHDRYLVGGTEQGVVYVYDIADPSSPVFTGASAYLSQVVGYTGSDIEVRSISSTPDGKIYVGTSGGNYPQNPNNPSYVLLQLNVN